MDERTVFVIASNATFQALGQDEGAVVLRTDSGQLYTCNDTTVSLLKAIDGARDFGALIDRVMEEYEVERGVLAEDLSEIVAELEREGITVRTTGEA